MMKDTLIYGVGINDSKTPVSSLVGGKRVNSKEYRLWNDMLRRCYSAAFHLSKPTYKGCTVCDEWLLFSNFKSWVAGMYGDGLHLDKDLLVEDNKVYSPETCLFVTPQVNAMIANSKIKYNGLPTGVYIHTCGKYASQISKYKHIKHIGLFYDIEEALAAYNKERINYALELYKAEKNPTVKAALKEYANKINGVTWSGK